MVNEMNGGKRFVEVDALRGIAVIMMVAYHALFDLDFFSVTEIDMSSPPLWLAGRLTAFLFIFIAGLSLSLSHSRRILEGDASFSAYLNRGLRIFGYGLIITLATWIYPGDGVILFGVLHFIGAGIILSYPFMGKPWLALMAASLSIAAGMILSGFRADYPWLLWAGLRPHSFYSLDYLPLFPWLGVMLTGMSAGDVLYRGYRRRFDLDTGALPLSKPALLGRNSLKIYFIHQPVIIMIILVLNSFR